LSVSLQDQKNILEKDFNSLKNDLSDLEAIDKTGQFVDAKNKLKARIIEVKSELDIVNSKLNTSSSNETFFSAEERLRNDVKQRLMERYTDPNRVKVKSGFATMNANVAGYQKQQAQRMAETQARARSQAELKGRLQAKRAARAQQKIQVQNQQVQMQSGQQNQQFQQQVRGSFKQMSKNATAMQNTQQQQVKDFNNQIAQMNKDEGNVKNMVEGVGSALGPEGVAVSKGITSVGSLVNEYTDPEKHKFAHAILKSGGILGRAMAKRQEKKLEIKKKKEFQSAINEVEDEQRKQIEEFESKSNEELSQGVFGKIKGIYHMIRAKGMKSSVNTSVVWPAAFLFFLLIIHVCDVAFFKLKPTPGRFMVMGGVGLLVALLATFVFMPLKNRDLFESIQLLLKYLLVFEVFYLVLPFALYNFILAIDKGYLVFFLYITVWGFWALLFLGFSKKIALFDGAKALFKLSIGCQVVLIFIFALGYIWLNFATVSPVLSKYSVVGGDLPGFVDGFKLMFDELKGLVINEDSLEYFKNIDRGFKVNLCENPVPLLHKYRPSDDECELLLAEIKGDVETVNYELSVDANVIPVANKKGKHEGISGEGFKVDAEFKENGLPVDLSEVKPICKYEYLSNGKIMYKKPLTPSIVGNTLICEQHGLVSLGDYVFDFGYTKTEKSVSNNIITFVDNAYYNKEIGSKDIEQNKGYGVLNLVMDKKTKRYNLLNEGSGLLRFTIVSNWDNKNKDFNRYIDNVHYIALLIPKEFKELDCGKDFNIEKEDFVHYNKYTLLKPGNLLDNKKNDVLSKVNDKISNGQNIQINCKYTLEDNVIYGTEKDFTITALSSYTYSVKKRYNVEVKDETV
jgi:hypothetical protein